MVLSRGGAMKGGSVEGGPMDGRSVKEGVP